MMYGSETVFAVVARLEEYSVYFHKYEYQLTDIADQCQGLRELQVIAGVCEVTNILRFLESLEFALKVLDVVAKVVTRRTKMFFEMSASASQLQKIHLQVQSMECKDALGKILNFTNFFWNTLVIPKWLK